MIQVYPREKFHELVQEFAQQEETLLDWKAEEYSEGVDRLQNFREIADFTGTNNSSVALLYLLKHIQSISLAVRTNKYTWKWETESGEGLKQRIADARNYLLLLAACLDEDARRYGQSDRSNESVSQWLQDNGYEGASKAVDCAFDL